MSLNRSENVFQIEPKVAEIGDMLVYSFTQSGGRIAIDATEGEYSDYKILNGILDGKINETKNHRFSVLINTGPITKYFSSEYKKYYARPGNYTLRVRLEDDRSFEWIMIVHDRNIFIINGSNLILFKIIFDFRACV